MQAADESQTQFFLTPEVQDAFWATLDPDIRSILINLESKESWTYQFEELPPLFTEMANALPRVVATPPSLSSRGLLRKIIPVLANMPIRQAVSATAYMDKGVTGDSPLGWAVLCYMEASRISNEEPDSPIYLQCKIVTERINVLLRTKLAAELFCNLSKTTKEEA